jgi:hypothetical protein
MRRPFLVLLLATLAACSRPGDEKSYRSSEPEGIATSDATERASPGPNVSVTAAPGVAFTYAYVFRLPAQRISAVQEQHAQACEKLGPSRCRITGLRYRLVSEREIEAMLSFKLDPSIAREFGKNGTDLVAQAEGALIDSEISGEDVGPAIKAGTRSLAQLTEELRHIEEQLARKGLPAVEREQLQAQAEQLRQSIRANSDTHAEQQEALASTPMTFTYHSEHSRPPLREAAKNAGDAFVTGISILLTIVITLLPWLLLLGLGWALFRMVRSRWPARRQDSAPQPQDAP